MPPAARRSALAVAAILAIGFGYRAVQNARLCLPPAHEERVRPVLILLPDPDRSPPPPALSPDGRYLVVQRAPEGEARGQVGAAFSGDSSLLATWRGGVIRLWNVGDGSRRYTLPEEPAPVIAVCFGPADRRLAALRSDGRTIVWDLGADQLSRRLLGQVSEARRVEFVPDGKALVVVGAAEAVRYDLHTGIARPVDVPTVDSARGPLDLARGDGGTVLLKDPESGLVRCILKTCRPPIRVAALTPDRSRLAVGREDGVTELWDTSTGQLVGSWRDHRGLVYCLAVSPDGRILASGGVDGVVCLWNTRRARRLRSLKGHRGGVRSLAFSADGRLLASGSVDNTARIWDVAGGKCTAVLSGHKRYVWDLAFSPDGAKLATASEDATARLWDAATGQELAVLQGHEYHVTDVAFSPHGATLATSSYDGTARIWDTATGRQLAVLEHEYRVEHLAFSPDGTRLATGTGDRWIEAPGVVRIWGLGRYATERKWSLEVAGQYVAALSFSADGGVLAARDSTDRVRLLDVATGAERRLESWAELSSWPPALTQVPSPELGVRLVDPASAAQCGWLLPLPVAPTQSIQKETGVVDEQTL